MEEGRVEQRLVEEGRTKVDSALFCQRIHET